MEVKEYMQELKINSDYKLIPIDSVIPDPENARLHDKADIEEKKAALKMFGWTRPAIVNADTNIVCVGNGFLQAAKELGYTQIPAIFIPMSAARAKSLAISDNKLGDHGRYDLDIFNANIRDIYEAEVNLDWTAIGFQKNEIELLLASMNTQITDSGVPQEGGQDAPQDFDPENEPGRAIKLTKGQREIIDLAVKTLRESENNPKLSEGQCIEMISANYLSGV